MFDQIEIVNQIHVQDQLTALLFENGVVEIVWDTSLRTVDKIHLLSAVEATGTLGGGKKMPILYTAHDFLDISKEGGRFASSAEGLKYTLGSAFIEDNLAKKILFQLYLTVNKPKAPTKSFSTREAAIQWLLKLQATYNRT